MNLSKKIVATMILASINSVGFAAEKDFNATLNEQNPYTFDQEVAVSGVVGSVAHKVVHTILPLTIEARYFAPHFDAKVQSDSIEYNGGSVGLKDQFGIDNSGAPELMVGFAGFGLDYIHVHSSGNSNLSSILNFGDSLYNGNISTKSDFDYIKLSYESNIISVLGNGVSWNAGIAAMHWSGEVKGSNIYGYNVSESKDYWAPLPMIGIGGHAQIPMVDSLKFHGRISGLPLGGLGHFYDLELGLNYYPIDNLSLALGYRRINVHLEHKDDYGDLTLNGPYAGLKYEF